MTGIGKLFTIGVFPVILILVLLFVLTTRINSPQEELIEFILPMTLNGRVVEKKIDYKNHATKSVIIKEQNNKLIELYDSFWHPIYDASTIGDSIYKNDGSARIYIVDKNNIEKEIKYRLSNYYLHKRNWKNK